MKKLRTGIIGVGKITPYHTRALQHAKNSELSAVFSRSKSKADDFAQQFNIAGHSDIEEMIRESK